ncbi:uncharacterized protein METZ01_LOCUS388532 [marine metagenome]|uniref:Uncharacterized protein n=1 Tax=marine metagenome TaxID=408172 RepID=A0A382UPP2_9ZZZZ
MVRYISLLLFVGLAFWSCEEEQDNVVSPSNEVDIDWCLVKTPSIYHYFESDDGQGVEVVGVGYFFYFTNLSNITDLSIEEFDNDNGPDYIIFNNTDGILSFSYDGENFSFDLSGSYVPSVGKYLIRTGLDNSIQRIIYNPEMNYATLFGLDGFWGIGLNAQSPNELIDYR